jgi:flagellar hook-length control protein FliK
VKSASWAAAASALREALQKSGAPSQEPTQAAQSSPVTSQSANRIGQEAVVPMPVAAGQTAAGSNPGRASTDANHSVHEASGRADATSVALTAAIGAQARQQSEGSQADLGSGSSSSYKAPLKHTIPTPVFSVPAAFARTLESGAASATPALPPPFRSTNLSSVGPQIVKGLQLQVTAGGGDMRLTLTPEHLGTVSIEVGVVHDRVKATLMADTPAVRQWIATHQEDLRQRLEAAGLTLEDLVVKEDAGQSRQERQDERQAPQKRRAPSIDGDQQAFEVVV